MNETVFVVPEFLQSYHDIGIYPENYDVYPHPVMDDQYSGQLIIPEFSSAITLPWLIILPLIIIFLFVAVALAKKKQLCGSS